MRGTCDFELESSSVFGLKLVQPARGYRYSVDAFLLAFFASRFQSGNVVEFGCGCGIISLLMAKTVSSFKSYELFEIQRGLCACATQNISQNPMPGREFVVRCEDLRFAIPSRKAGLVVCNPPFRSPDSGRISRNHQRAVARNWFFLPPLELFTAFLRMRTDNNSGLCMVLPFKNFSHWQGVAEKTGLFASHLTYVHSFENREAALVLVRFGSERGKPSVSRLILYELDGTYTKIAREIMGFI